jgi:hypothetical protein
VKDLKQLTVKTRTSEEQMGHLKEALKNGKRLEQEIDHIMNFGELLNGKELTYEEVKKTLAEPPPPKKKKKK